MRGAFGDAGDVAKERERGGVEIDTYTVHAVFDGAFERFVEITLIDVVLILADADGFGINFDEFGERILQATRDGDGAADSEIEIWEFLPGHLRRGIDRCAGLIHDNAEDV